MLLKFGPAPPPKTLAGYVGKPGMRSWPTRCMALLPDLQRTHLYPEPDRSESFKLLRLTYLAADSVVYNLSCAGLSLITANRVRWASEHTGDPCGEAVFAYLRIRSLWASSSWNDVLDALCADIKNSHVTKDAESLAVWGGLQLRAAITAARKNDADEAWSRHRLATEVVARLGPRQRVNHYDLSTNQTNVDIRGVAVALELGDGSQAVQRGEVVRLTKDTQAGRVRRHHLDPARALLWCGKREAALAELERAEKVAFLLVRNHRWPSRPYGYSWILHGAVIESRSAVSVYACTSLKLCETYFKSHCF